MAPKGLERKQRTALAAIILLVSTSLAIASRLRHEYGNFAFSSSMDFHGDALLFLDFAFELIEFVLALFVAEETPDDVRSKFRVDRHQSDGEQFVGIECTANLLVDL